MEAYQKLKGIFNGLTRAHGVFYRGETKESGKVGGKAYILKEEVTDKYDNVVPIVPLQHIHEEFYTLIDQLKLH